MTELEKRVVALKRLTAEVRENLEALNSISKNLREWLARYKNKNPELEMCYAFAALLHHYYTGVESCLKRIVKEIDGSLPGGAEWHLELLRTASVTVDSVRPAVIDKNLRYQLDEYRRFRHLFRNAYGHEIKWNSLSTLLMEHENVHERAKSALAAFLKFIDNLIKTIEEGST